MGELQFSVLYFLTNIIVITAVATTVIAFAIMDGSCNPSGACKIYPMVIKIHKYLSFNIQLHIHKRHLASV